MRFERACAGSTDSKTLGALDPVLEEMHVYRVTELRR